MQIISLNDPVGLVVNIIIILLAVFIIMWINKLLLEIKHNEEKVYRTLNGVGVLEREMDGDVNMKVVTGTSIKLTDVNEVRKEYDKICVQSNTIAQLIPVFPSLGIFGTVLGIMMQIDADDPSKMASSIGLALSTTLVAVIATIILKVIMALLVDSKIAYINTRFEDYDRYRKDLLDKDIINKRK